MSAIAIGGALVLVMVGLDRIANMVVRPTPRPPDRTIEDVRGLAYADFDVPAGDRELAAWTLHPRTTPRRPVFLIAHDWGASYGTILRLGEPLARAGFEVVLFDIRGHGRNEEVPYVTVRHFRDDITAAVRHMRVRHPGRPVVLVGHSLGGAGAVLSVAEGAPVDGLVLIATPADVLAVTAEFLSDHGLPGRLIVNVCRPFFWRRVGGSFRPLTPHRRIREIHVPLLHLHPERDTRVARAHADRLAKASGVPYALIAGAEHTDVLEHPETVRRVVAFAESLE